MIAGVSWLVFGQEMVSWLSGCLAVDGVFKAIDRTLAHDSSGDHGALAAGEPRPAA